MRKQWEEVLTLPLGILEVDTAYQRNLDLNWAKSIAENFNPRLLEVLQVSYRRGHYYVFDGQHTLKALEIKFGDTDYPVACKVYHGLTKQEEAQLFCDFNMLKKRISPISVMKAQAISGNEITIDFLKCTEDAGFIIDPSKKINCRYGINAVKKAEACFLTLGSDMYSRMLLFIHETWKGEKWSVSRDMLGGMALLFRVFNDELTLGKFVKQLKNISEDDIIKESHNYVRLSCSYRFAWAIGKFYNSRSKKNILNLKKLNFLE